MEIDLTNQMPWIIAATLSLISGAGIRGLLRTIPKKDLGAFSRMFARFVLKIVGIIFAKIKNESARDTVWFMFKSGVDEIDNQLESKKPEGEK